MCVIAGLGRDLTPNQSSAPLGIPERSVCVRRGVPATVARQVTAAQTCSTNVQNDSGRRGHVATKAIVGEKVGMTQVWDDQNRAVPVTVLKVAPVRVVQVKTPETDGYSALQVTWGFRRNSTLSKPALGHYAKAGVNPGRKLVELRLDDVADYTVGQELAADLWEAGERVDAISVSKGKGFAGGMKRHNFKGQGGSHGQPRPPPRARLHRRLRHAVARVQGHEDGRARWAAPR